MAKFLTDHDIVGGESIAVRVPVPAGTTAASVQFTGGLTVSLAIADGHAVGTVQSGATAGLPHDCGYAVFAVIGGESPSTECVASGSFTVRKVTSDFRAALAAVDEAIRNWGSNPNQTISVGEINISYKTLGDLLSLRSFYAARVAEESVGGDGARSGYAFAQVLTRFGRC